MKQLVLSLALLALSVCTPRSRPKRRLILSAAPKPSGAAAYSPADSSGHIDGKLHDRIERGARAADRGQYLGLCRFRPLHRHAHSSRRSPASSSKAAASMSTTSPKPAPLKVNNESGNGLSNVRGTVGLARTSDPHGGNCQFYVNLNDNAALDPNATRWGYAVFGKRDQRHGRGRPHRRGGHGQTRLNGRNADKACRDLEDRTRFHRKRRHRCETLISLPE